MDGSAQVFHSCESELEEDRIAATWSRRRKFAAIAAVVLVEIVGVVYCIARPRSTWPSEPISLEGKSIYFLLVDRFSQSGYDVNDFSFCDWQTPHYWMDDGVDFSPHGGVLFGPHLSFGARCGGTLQGIIDRMDYIKGMGFDCIWMTPVITSSDYTGYLAEDFFSVDTHLGTSEDMQQLVDVAHDNGICVILGIVLNHVRPMSYVWAADNFKANAPQAYIGPSSLMPFNDPSYFHMYNSDLPHNYEMFEWYVMNGIPPAQVGDALGDSSVLKQHVKEGRLWCGPENPEITTCTCMPGNSGPHCPGSNPKLQNEGWFANLADLNQSVPFVRQKLLDYVRLLRDNFEVDGFRLDTAIYMEKDFLREAQQVAERDILGEATVNNMTYHASYQHEALNGLLNFPVFYQVPQAFCQMRMEGDFGDYSLQGTFTTEAPNLTKLAIVMQEQQKPGVYKNPDLLGNFFDNHDEFARIAHYCKKDQSRMQNAMVWLFMSRGAPIIYYGTEQGLAGHQATAKERLSPWTSNAFLDQFSSQANVRESLWQTRYRTDTWQYNYIATLNSIRKRLQITIGEQKFHFISDEKLIFTRTSKTSGKDVWVFINNIPWNRASEPVTYCAAPLKGRRWREAIAGTRVTLKDDGCFTATSSSPQILEEVVTN